MFNLYYKDDQINIELLLNLIINKKLKILDNKNKNIFNKVKYILKLGIYS